MPLPARKRTVGRSAWAPIALAVAASITLVPAVASARAPVAGIGEEGDSRRNELYREAMKAAAAGRWSEAKERLRAVLAIRSSPKVYFSLGQAEEQLGQLASAQADYARALEEAAAAGKADVVQAAEQAQRALASRVPHVRVLPAGEGTAGSPGSVRGAAATLDDRPVPFGVPTPLDPGEHRLVVSAPGMRTVTSSLRVTEGEALDVPVSLELEDTSAPSPPAPVTPRAPTAVKPSPRSEPPPRSELPPLEHDGEAPPHSSPWRTVGQAVFAVGVVGVGAGAVFGLEAISRHNDAQKACPGATCAGASGSGLWHDAVTFGDVSTLAFVLGGVGVAGGAILWATAPAPGDAGARVQVGIGPGAFQIRGAW